MNVGIVGAGRMGEKRARAVAAFRGTRLIAVADVHFAQAERLASSCRAKAYRRWQDLVRLPGLDALIVATPHKFLAPVSLEAVRRGKHVLCEKPMALSVREAEVLVREARRRRVRLRVGFNHRYYPAIAHAKALVDRGALARLFFIRGRYGHGGRPGYEKEWRADPRLAGGGQLMDQGIHLLDLFRWFLGEFAEGFGYAPTYFWKMRPLEDNVFALFKTRQGQVAQLHASTTQWKNLFSFEVFGEKGTITVEGLGGYYGPQELKLILRRQPGSRTPVPKVRSWTFADPEKTWVREWADFVENGRGGPEGEDGLRALAMLEAVYKSQRTGRAVRIRA